MFIRFVRLDEPNCYLGANSEDVKFLSSSLTTTPRSFRLPWVPGTILNWGSVTCLRGTQYWEPGAPVETYAACLRNSVSLSSIEKGDRYILQTQEIRVVRTIGRPFKSIVIDGLACCHRSCHIL